MQEHSRRQPLCACKSEGLQEGIKLSLAENRVKPKRAKGVEGSMRRWWLFPVFPQLGFFCVCGVAQVTQILIKQNREPHIVSSLLKEWELE